VRLGQAIRGYSMARLHPLTPPIFQQEVLPSYSTTDVWLGLAFGTLSLQFESRCCIQEVRLRLNLVCGLIGSPLRWLVDMGLSMTH
jgi:hypothetical protein